MFPKQLLSGSIRDTQKPEPWEELPVRCRGDTATALTLQWQRSESTGKHSSPEMRNCFHLPNNAASEIKRSLENTDVWFWQCSKLNNSSTNSPSIDTNTEMLHESHQKNTSITDAQLQGEVFPQKKLFWKEEVSLYSSPLKILLLSGKTHLPERTPAIASLGCLTGCPTSHSVFVFKR